MSNKDKITKQKKFISIVSSMCIRNIKLEHDFFLRLPEFFSSSRLPLYPSHDSNIIKNPESTQLHPILLPPITKPDKTSLIPHHSKPAKTPDYISTVVDSHRDIRIYNTRNIGMQMTWVDSRIKLRYELLMTVKGKIGETFKKIANLSDSQNDHQYNSYMLSLWTHAFSNYINFFVFNNLQTIEKYNHLPTAHNLFSTRIKYDELYDNYIYIISPNPPSPFNHISKNTLFRMDSTNDLMSMDALVKLTQSTIQTYYKQSAEIRFNNIYTYITMVAFQFWLFVNDRFMKRDVIDPSKPEYTFIFNNKQDLKNDNYQMINLRMNSSETNTLKRGSEEESVLDACFKHAINMVTKQGNSNIFCIGGETVKFARENSFIEFLIPFMSFTINELTDNHIHWAKKHNAYRDNDELKRQCIHYIKYQVMLNWHNFFYNRQFTCHTFPTDTVEFLNGVCGAGVFVNESSSAVGHRKFINFRMISVTQSTTNTKKRFTPAFFRFFHVISHPRLRPDSGIFVNQPNDAANKSSSTLTTILRRLLLHIAWFSNIGEQCVIDKFIRRGVTINDMPFTGSRPNASDNHYLMYIADAAVYRYIPIISNHQFDDNIVMSYGKNEATIGSISLEMFLNLYNRGVKCLKMFKNMLMDEKYIKRIKSKLGYQDYITLLDIKRRAGPDMTLNNIFINNPNVSPFIIYNFMCRLLSLLIQRDHYFAALEINKSEIEATVIRLVGHVIHNVTEDRALSHEQVFETRNKLMESYNLYKTKTYKEMSALTYSNKAFMENFITWSHDPIKQADQLKDIHTLSSYVMESVTFTSVLNKYITSKSPAWSILIDLFCGVIKQIKDIQHINRHISLTQLDNVQIESIYNLIQRASFHDWSNSMDKCAEGLWVTFNWSNICKRDVLYSMLTSKVEAVDDRQSGITSTQLSLSFIMRTFHIIYQSEIVNTVCNGIEFIVQPVTIKPDWTQQFAPQSNIPEITKTNITAIETLINSEGMKATLHDIVTELRNAQHTQQETVSKWLKTQMGTITWLHSMSLLPDIAISSVTKQCINEIDILTNRYRQHSGIISRYTSMNQTESIKLTMMNKMITEMNEEFSTVTSDDANKVTINYITERYGELRSVTIHEDVEHVRRLLGRIFKEVIDTQKKCNNTSFTNACQYFVDNTLYNITENDCWFRSLMRMCGIIASRQTRSELEVLDTDIIM